MPALARGQASDCANPELDVFFKVNGILTDVFSLEYVIEEDVTTPGTPIQVFPASGRATSDVSALCPTGDKISTGNYVALYTPVLSEPIGTHKLRWFFKLTASSPEQTFSEEFEVLPEASASSGDGYCTVGELRGLGVPSTGVGAKTDAQLQFLIQRASRLIDLYTGRYFSPRTLTIRLNGTGRHGLLLGDPIISISSIKLIGDDLLPTVSEIELDDVRIYNRHLSQNLINPDDRENPLIEFLVFDERHETFGLQSAHNLFHPHRWPEGTQNVEVSGIFGYTEFDGSATGRTPDLISMVTCLMVIRDLPSPFLNPDKREDARNRWRVKRLKTRDQEIEYISAEKLGSRAVGFFTGDPEIDKIIAAFVRPPNFGAV